MNAEITVKNTDYAGLFMVTLATLMYEILLTRIFSVTMWYHFAFMAISIALFGMTVGALLVYLFPHFFTQENAKYHLAFSSFLFSVTIILSFLVHLGVPFNFELSARGIASITTTYIAISIPFIFSGISVCLALTKFPSHVSKLYAYDLAGAGIGCIIFKFTLDIMDGPTAVFFIAFLATIGSILFAVKESQSRKKLLKFTILFSVCLMSFVVINTLFVRAQSPLVQLKWVKGSKEQKPLYEKWNSFSRVTVGQPVYAQPFGWGLSSSFAALHFGIPQSMLLIDAGAGTVLTKFDGDLTKLNYLKYDITNLPHYMRDNAKILVIGTGGGRDILSALVFNQKSILGIEINNTIIDVVTKRFAGFTGYLDRNPKVTFVNDEARSYIARTKEKFDVVQVSLIDTWAATAAGAYVLAENSLYTVEAWNIFLERLNPDGILTFSRWYHRDSPHEMYRLTSLAVAALKESGIKNPKNHIILARKMNRVRNVLEPAGVGTILLSREPFSAQDIDTIERTTRDMQFDMVQSPRFSLNTMFATIVSGKDISSFIENFPINITAPTDDSPFFFQMLRFKHMFKHELWEQSPEMNLKAVFILGVLLIIVFILTIMFIIVPLVLTSGKVQTKNALPLFIFFASIGFGFIFIEISQLQRLIVFLGHPTYSLTVVLFTLLVSSGIGSYLTKDVKIDHGKNSAILRLFLLLCAIVVFGLFTPHVITEFRAATTAVRIALSVSILFVLGLFMGMAFPLGMKIANKKSASLTPWLWGMNGATSVCGSVLAIVIALASGISTSFWTGFFFYITAFVSFVFAVKGMVKKDGGGEVTP